MKNKDFETQMSECTRQNTCYDCDDKKCGHHGDKGADCPKYHCDYEPKYDCDHCAFINNFIRKERERYKNEKYDN